MKIYNNKFALTISNKFFSIDFYKKIDIKDWMIFIPKYKNWTRFTLNTPFFGFSIHGWLLFGKKPE
jgi:hypothetical protein